MINVSRLQQRTERYEFADGIRELQFAFCVLVTGFYGWVVWDMPSVWQPFSEWVRTQNVVVMIGLTFVLPIGVPLVISQFGLRWANEYLRRRWLWRTTGFIKPKPWIVPRRTLFASFAIMFAVFIAGILLAIQLKEASLIIRGIYVGTGFEFAYMWLAMAKRFNLPRYRVVAVVGLVSTIILALLPMRVGLFVLIISVFWGGLLMVSGLYAMRQTALEQRANTDAR